MNNSTVPQPIVFDLSVGESARLRYGYMAANGYRLSLVLVIVSLVLQLLPPILRVYRYRGNDPLDWILLGLVFVVFVVALSALGARAGGRACCSSRNTARR